MDVPSYSKGILVIKSLIYNCNSERISLPPSIYQTKKGDDKAQGELGLTYKEGRAELDWPTNQKQTKKLKSALGVQYAKNLVMDQSRFFPQENGDKALMGPLLTV